MKNMISPSMMCADIMALKETIQAFEKNGIEYLHIDIMDGSFVPNYCLGTDYCKKIKKVSNIPLDIHLMVENPENKLQYFDFSDGDYVSVHVESTRHLQRALQYIKSKGARAMVAINPATNIECLNYVLGDIDGVLVMTVNPGFAGQKMIPSSLDKIKNLKEYLNSINSNIKIEVDGNVSYENALLMSKAGADIFVAGTSSVFKGGDIVGGVAKLKKIITSV